MILIKNIDKLNLYIKIPNSIVNELINQIEMLVVTLKMMDFDVALDESVTHKGDYYLINIRANKGEKRVCFDLMCCPSSLELQKVAFMVFGIEDEEARKTLKKIAITIQKDFVDAKTMFEKFEMVKQQKSFFVKTKDDVSTIPYLVSKIIKFI